MSEEALQLNGNKLIYHTDRLNDWIEGKRINPIYVAFSPSSLCNHSCTFCVYHYKKFEPIYFPLDRFKSLVEELKQAGVRSMFFAGDGEPLLNKNCLEMLRLTKKNGIDVAMNTNGLMANPKYADGLVENLSWIRFSINAGTSETYSKVHRTSPSDFEKVLANVEALVVEKKKRSSKIAIGVQCVLLNENVHEIETLARKVKSIGGDYLAVKPFLKHPKTTWEASLDNKDDVLRDLQNLESLNDDNFMFLLRDGNFQVTERPYKSCLSGEFMIEIDAKGDVYSCGPHIGNDDHRYGNIMRKPFEEMWRSSECIEKIKNIQENLDVSKCMPFCRPDSVNKTLWEIKHPPNHVNFI